MGKSSIFVTLALADPDLVRQVDRTLGAAPEVTVLARTDDLDDGMQEILASRPEVAVLEWRPGVAGVLTLLKHLRSAHFPTRSVVLVDGRDAAARDAATAAGADVVIARQRIDTLLAAAVWSCHDEVARPEPGMARERFLD